MKQAIYKLLGNTGKALTLRKVTQGNYNPSTGAMSGQSTSDVPVTGHLIAYKAKEVDGVMVRSNDIKAVLSSEGVVTVPTIQDRLVDGANDFEIVDVHDITLKGVSVAFICQLRR